MKQLLIFSWTLWAALCLLSLYALVRIATERTSSPEAGRGLGVFVVGVLMLLLVAAGLGLFFAAKRPSLGGVIVITVLLAWPVVAIVARPLIMAFKDRRYRQAEERNGDFGDAKLQLFAHAILANDAGELKHLLESRSLPSERDRAGNDVLALAVFAVCERHGGIEPLRVLLEAGADPRTSKMPEGSSLILRLILSRYRAPQADEAIKLLLKHGADPDEVDPGTKETALRSAGGQPDVVRLLVENGAEMDRLDTSGLPAVVHFTSTRDWESAIYLVEKGARLDVTNSSGVSLDYYLNDWKDGVFGQQYAGWDKLRTAIAARRALPK